MKRLLAALTLLLITQTAFAFDHRHVEWSALLKQHVALIGNGNASQVNYAGVKTDRAALKKYLDALSAVSEADYRRWSKPQQLAFLINAYNAFTVELILTRYPDLKSIKDLGSVLQSPWKKTFFTLLGKERSLDDVEHGMIRAPGAFDELRIHAAVNCASIGCPMLRDEAFAADRLDAQLEDGMRRFLADRTRNRFDAAGNTLSVSKISIGTEAISRRVIRASPRWTRPSPATPTRSATPLKRGMPSARAARKSATWTTIGRSTRSDANRWET